MPRSSFLALFGALVFACAAAMPAHGATTVPNGFVDEAVGVVTAPTALAFTPDGRLLAASKNGQLYVMATDGSGSKVVAYDLGSVSCLNDERGLMGVAVDPNFATNGYIYMSYTRRRTNCTGHRLFGAAQRISRFTMSGNQVVPGSEFVLIDAIPNAGNLHVAGDLKFGKDGMLYATSGDGNCHFANGICGNGNTAARELNNLNGKLIRITPTGGIPGGNTWAWGARCSSGPTSSGNICAEIYAYGLRNPFRMIMDTNSSTTKFFVNDVGALKWEEVNEGKSGANYGWNVREGHCLVDSYTNCPAPGGYTNPIYDLPHTSGCASFVGGAVIPNGAWPAPYSGSLLFSDYVCGKIFRLVPQAGGAYTAADFATDMGEFSAIHVEWGPVAGGGEAMYYNSFGANGVIRRIRHVGAVNRPPTAVIDASPKFGPLPLNVNFDGGGSSDPDGDPITYEWDFGDGTPKQTTTSPTVSHPYVTAGTYTATLRAKDDEGLFSQPVTVTIAAGNTAPTITITAPDPSYRFRVGDQITLRAEATDPEDGPLPGSAIEWEAVRYHHASTPQSHTHPYLPPTTGSEVTVTAPAPEDLHSTTNSYIEVKATATDSKGITRTVTRDIGPKYVWMTFESNPNKVNITANGVRFTTPYWFVSWPGYNLFVVAPARTGLFNFRRWSDGNTSNQRWITTPDYDSNWKAIYCC